MILTQGDQERFDANEVEKKILFRSLLSILILGLLLASVVAFPLYEELKQQSTDKLEYIANSKKTVLDSYFSKISNISSQITSMTKVRQKLIEYNDGKIALSEATAFSKGILLDAITSSNDIVGLTRYAKDGQKIVDVGNIPFEVNISSYNANSSIIFPKNEEIIVVISKIVDKNYGFCGTDVLFFNRGALKNIVRNYTGLGSSGELVLLNRTKDGFAPLFSYRNNQKTAILERSSFGELKPNETKLFEQTVDGQKYTNVIFALDMANVTPLVRIKNSELFEVINSNMIRICLIGLATLILSVLAVFLLTYPLLKQLARELARRSEAELELQRINNGLNNMVKEEVQKQMLITQSRQAAMGEMLTMIAHHWRQPLNRVGVIVQNIQDDYLYGEMEEIKLRETVGDVMMILGDISSTINRFSGVMTNSEQQQSFDPCEEVENIINLFQPEFKSHFISVEFRKIAGLALFGDQVQFGEVVYGLLKNAEEALISTTEQERKITIEFERHDKSLEIGVWDNGDPIPEEFLSRIFDPFFTTKGITAKIGLGLYSAKMLIEQQFMGTIKVINIQNGVKCIIEIPDKRDIK